MIVALLLACATHEPARVAPDMAPPPSPPPAEVAAPPPPAAWRAGVHAGPALSRSPVEKWSRMLPGPVTEPVTTDGERIYAVAEGRVYCFDLAGSPLWNIRSLASGGVLPTPDGPAVGTETGSLLVLDATNGATLRSTTGTGAVRGVPVQLASSLAWVTVDGVVASTADWRHQVAHSAAGAVAADGETVYVATIDGALVAATRDGVLWQGALPAPAVDGPALDADHVYVPVSATPGNPGGVVAFDRAGKEVWRRQTEFQPAGALSVGDHVYVPDKDGHVYALDRKTGAVVWAAEGYGEFTAQPAVVDGQVYAGNGDGNLYRIDTDDGGAVWKAPLGAAVTGDPVMVGGMLVVGLANGRLVALVEG